LLEPLGFFHFHLDPNQRGKMVRIEEQEETVAFDSSSISGPIMGGINMPYFNFLRFSIEEETEGITSNPR
jgi:hypothetical protein